MSELIDNLYKLRRNFILIGLTGRTGSGCSSTARILATQNLDNLPSNYRETRVCSDVERRKNRIVNRFLRHEDNWSPFTIITASDIIFYFALREEFDAFKKSFIEAGKPYKNKNTETAEEQFKTRTAQIEDAIETVRADFNNIHKTVSECEIFLDKLKYFKPKKDDNDFNNDFKRFSDLILTDIKVFRSKLSKSLEKVDKHIIAEELQRWGTNIRNYNSILKKEQVAKTAPSCLAEKINSIIKMFRAYNKYNDEPTAIVIDALRNPFEILYFRERYSAFYCLSVSTDVKIRRDNLYKKGYTHKDIEKLEETESAKGDLNKSYMDIDVDRCIELSDIHLAHDGTPIERNKELVDKIITYIALIKHPGLIPPTPQERLMQIAYTAKLNSGCLSRQVGAAVTDSNFSLKAIGWNTTAQGQTPCSLRSLINLYQHRDDIAFSDYELEDDKFRDRVEILAEKYLGKGSDKESPIEKLKGLNLSYCFKDYYTDLNYDKQAGNQVHTRSLHAEENAFLQLAKYGTEGINGGYLFTTASCCELCGKKAYQLGIKKIYYIDSYPGITARHILGAGTLRPDLELFIGAVGRAYISLYNPILPLKDEIEEITGVDVKIEKNKHKKSDSEINNGGNKLHDLVELNASENNDATEAQNDNDKIE